MPHQCVHCSKIYPSASKELLEGCSECGGGFFFYIRDEQLKKMQENPLEENPVSNASNEEKKHIEQDIRDIAGMKDDDSPVILDLESVRAIGEGKFEIDVVNLFNNKRPLIYSFEEGRYIIDLGSKRK